MCRIDERRESIQRLKEKNLQVALNCAALKSLSILVGGLF